MPYLSQITLNHHCSGMTNLLEKDLIDAMWGFLEGRLSSYLQSALKHEDAEMFIHMDVKKHSDADLYDGKFSFKINGKEYLYEADAFKNPLDLVSHATQHLKEQLADK